MLMALSPDYEIDCFYTREPQNQVERFCYIFPQMNEEEINQEFVSIGEAVNRLSEKIEEIENRMVANSTTLNQILSALDGARPGLPGLVSMVVEQDKRIKALEGISAKQGIFISLLSVGLTYAFQYLIKHLP